MGFSYKLLLIGNKRNQHCTKRLNWQVETVIPIRTRKQHLPWKNYNVSNLSINLTLLWESSNSKRKIQWSPSSIPRSQRETQSLPSHSSLPSPSPSLLTFTSSGSFWHHLLLLLFLKWRPAAAASAAERTINQVIGQLECFSINVKRDRVLTSKF